MFLMTHLSAYLVLRVCERQRVGKREGDFWCQVNYLLEWSGGLGSDKHGLTPCFNLFMASNGSLALTFMTLSHFKVVYSTPTSNITRQLLLVSFGCRKSFSLWKGLAYRFVLNSKRSMQFGLHISCSLLRDSEMHAWGHPHPHPPPTLRCFVWVFFLCFWVSTPIHLLGNVVSFFLCVLFLICLFGFLLFALLTCFVSFFPFCFLSAIQYLQMKWPLLDVQPGGLQSRQALKDARSPSPAHIVVSNTQLGTFALLPPSFMTDKQMLLSFCLPSCKKHHLEIFWLKRDGIFVYIYP